MKHRFSLPTEAEWELSARSGTTSEIWTGEGSQLGGTYSSHSPGNGVDDTSVTVQDGISNPPLSDYAWFAGNQNDPVYTATTKPAGLKVPNGFGLYDMYGNVEEWTADSETCDFPVSIGDPWCSEARCFIHQVLLELDSA